ncbi:MAG: hypothetical protein JHC55_02300 [Mycolicibacterium sp.]|nr:hypothetical protein [Mycolicibacterium sp.]
MAAGAEAASARGPDFWTLGAGLLGGLVVAVVNHFFTRRREGTSWLRSEQVAANRRFHEAALALAHLATHGIPGKPMSDAADDIHLLDRELLARAQEMLVIGETQTVNAALIVSELLPKLTYQTIPLPKTTHPAALKQREDALCGIGEMLFVLEMRMRQGVGLGLLAAGGRKTVKQLRANTSFEQQALSPVDRDGPRPELIKLLRDWEVLTMVGGGMPEKLADYYNDAPVDALPTGGYCLALLRKPPDGFWLFTISKGIPPKIETTILEDAVRIVTGHIRAFSPQFLHNYSVVGVDEEFPGDTFTWSSARFPEVDFSGIAKRAKQSDWPQVSNRNT